ncbi:pyridoxamine 5'-phosphate oxidase family protein [Aestuariirhabdus sp. Z084]|uniref:pyridoxamine 5'-phosphate oxidase family protein n=1 Tax=Aestuariirhabdus haliotis TaxID=2918751 RepID=UPI00201B43B9|nr:pyridoxamine 5'-phosphate oxidase family protein [Aestuariirhabdus haliotis]MCL6415304.1 pyridoxamine 5'-phosphate oxidase family protein [Aestuariirhabdus haliotis]MCL6419564.1 pyridoxamine 5'-phosphate oxidase family protein [Aestuariirhabdus haliotis]
MATIAMTERTRVRRGPKRAEYSRDTINQILDEALVCHLAANRDSVPMVQPTLHWRMGDQLYVHGSSKNGLFKALLQGQTGCVTVTLLDGLVYARSEFSHSVNYRSVMLYGKARLVSEDAEKQAALRQLMVRFREGRVTGQARSPNEAELKATSVLAFDIDEASAKVRATGPSCNPEDLAWPVWTGVIPVSTVLGTPVPWDDERQAFQQP